MTDAIREAGERIAAAGESGRRHARDPVNLPIIENWIEAIGDDNPVYTDPQFAAASAHGELVAPPAMIQVWTMNGQLQPVPAGGSGGSPPRANTGPGGDPTGEMVDALNEAGYTSVVATNCDQVYNRYLRHGEQIEVRVALTDLVGPKQTALGEGWFFTTRNTWYSGDEPVATMDFRILKFRPRAVLARGDDPPNPPAGGTAPKPGKPAAPDLGPVMRPVISPDTAFFWAGTAIGELRVQSCGDCGTLRHPPGPLCMACGSPNPKYIVAAGTGEVFSYVVHHHPPVPGKKLPLVIALVELTEGVRVLAELTGVDPDKVEVGMPVEVSFLKIDEELVLPAWRPATPATVLAQDGRPVELSELAVDVNTTFVVASALATRDFTKVHHDRDFAVASGSKDIFVNILTTTGLVQRFVSAWAGHQAIFRSIKIRLGAPCYAGDTLTFTGQVSEHTADEEADRYEVAVIGKCSLGNHVTSTVCVDVPRSQS
ncbi:MAG TPA: OB-fold domain-containing protein [Streptosporangiaceae bacterium]